MARVVLWLPLPDAASASLLDNMNAVEDISGGPQAADMSPETLQQAKFLYHVSVQVVRGKARRIVMRSEVTNIIKLWMDLLAEYEGREPGRHQVMLVGLLKRERWTNFNVAQFDEAVLEWKKN